MHPRRRLRATFLVALAAAGCSASRHPPAAATIETVLNSGQTSVTGAVVTATVTGVTSPVALPITITIPNRGHGGLSIRGITTAITGGGRADGTVVWDGGQPLPLSGTGGLDLGPVTLTVDAGGTTWNLDGKPRFLTAGHYRAGATLAVGTAGLATPEDNATFSVKAGTEGQLETVGGAQIHTPPAALSLTGPGTVVLDGTVTARTAAGTRLVHRVQFGVGPFELHMAPAAGGDTVTGLLQGPIVMQ